MPGIFIEAAIQLIRDEPGLTAPEYARLAFERELVTSTAQDPLLSFQATLSSYISRSVGLPITRRYENGAYRYYPADGPGGTGAATTEQQQRVAERTSRYSLYQQDFAGHFGVAWPPGIGAIRKLIAKATDDLNDDSFSPLERYLLGIVAYELERFPDAERLFEAALRGGIEAQYRSRAERFRDICTMKLGEHASRR